MKLKQWLDQAKTKIPALDAELIAIEYFADPYTRVDRSWILLHQDDNLRILIPDEMPRREEIMRVIETPLGFVSEKVPKDLQIRDLTVISRYTPASQQFTGNYCDLMLQFASYAVKTRSKGVPLAYILGRREFYGRDFLVSPATLIPRVETESLIDLVKAINLPEEARILEVGTGSGCIAITLKKEFPRSQVVAVDISDKALEIAEINDCFYDTNVKWGYSNLFQDLDFETLWQDGRDDILDSAEIDVVVANLPYVNADWDFVDNQALAFEPKKALYAKADNGLSLYKRLFKEMRGKCIARYLVLEADPCQHEALMKMAAWWGYIHIRTDGYGLLFESRMNYFWDYQTQKLRHKTAEEMADRSQRFASCCGMENFTAEELRERSEPEAEYEDWFR